VLQFITLSLRIACRRKDLETGRHAGIQTRRDTKKAGDQTHIGRTLYPAGYSLDLDQSSEGQPLAPEDCLLAFA